MIASCAPRSRAGITLTEILISILIMGIGLVSLATLFPLGMLRLRDAARNTRSAFLIESAAHDVDARGMLDRQTFTNHPWYFTNNFDPWLQDPSGTFGLDRRVGASTQPTFPVAYDPLWRHASRQPAAVGTRSDFPPMAGPNEARFGSGLGFIRDDPSGAGGSVPSAHGLQRITNFLPNDANLAWLWPFDTSGTKSWAFRYGGPDAVPYIPATGTFRQDFPTYDGRFIGDVFASPDDVVLQDEGDPASGGAGVGTPILPQLVPVRDVSTGTAILDQFTNAPLIQAQNDWSYTWMFTGRQIDAGKSTVLEGDVVVFHNRPFGTSATPSPFNAANSFNVPVDERVIEAVFGFGSIPATLAPGYAPGADRSVLVRWPATAPDPDIKAGSWIADVTYERFQATDTVRNPYFSNPAPNNVNPYPNQRCYWYQIARRSEPGPDPGFNGDPTGVAFRRMTLTLKTPVRAKTYLNAASQPVYVNVALFSPYVVNVYPKVFNTR